MKTLLDFIWQHPDSASELGFFVFIMFIWGIPALVSAFRDKEECSCACHSYEEEE